ncbi:hypothetical protein AN964_09765 [Heyndrickxia shackletonii]|uniref:DUF3892 domain-containing protein n=1 Tax=Heyndrickxia shackletonii TaxID=157838 RepID=A0A0Q3WWJ1_9BACI|nr:DUF3892 domain-containing protein [Heyndrickxia shackletonii]KQL53759.1 hypothetical protein AN964_09765 [Heyndrickxia shackletonii]MBB2481568.1 DUF3892 domain-containing protein [Bacillus sp. APMAM]NEY99908.1 DUF3892 domain-containing protein [Heyndrickxia shackletonii]RTZ55059.1 DUF3892 domain-containing protein [Bacillus sp. SAJ1]
MEHIIKVQRNYQGDIISFETSEGRIISYLKALMETENGKIEGTNIEWNHDGHACLYNNDENDKYFSNFPPIF